MKEKNAPFTGRKTKSWRYKNRHNHAIKRLRGERGRFLTKEEEISVRLKQKQEVEMRKQLKKQVMISYNANIE